jgi:hypothetical protein
MEAWKTSWLWQFPKKIGSVSKDNHPRQATCSLLNQVLRHSCQFLST